MADNRHDEAVELLALHVLYEEINGEDEDIASNVDPRLDRKTRLEVIIKTRSYAQRVPYDQYQAALEYLLNEQTIREAVERGTQGAESPGNG